MRSSVREFIASEAMAALGVPTTRALSLVATGDLVTRDMFYKCAPRLDWPISAPAKHLSTAHEGYCVCSWFDMLQVKLLHRSCCTEAAMLIHREPPVIHIVLSKTAELRLVHTFTMLIACRQQSPARTCGQWSVRDLRSL